MSDSSTKRTNTIPKGGKVLPALCNILGTLILILVIASCSPMVLPKFFGCQAYNVVSGSMEPEIPVGSLILVKGANAYDLQEGDIVAFEGGDSLITHRIVENHVIEGKLITKGDANLEEDLKPVEYSQVRGKVVFHMAMLGDYMALLSTLPGKIYLLILAICGVLFHVLASRLRARARLKAQAHQLALERLAEEAKQKAEKKEAENL